MAKFPLRLSEKMDRLQKPFKKTGTWNWGTEQEKDFGNITNVDRMSMLSTVRKRQG